MTDNLTHVCSIKPGGMFYMQQHYGVSLFDPDQSLVKVAVCRLAAEHPELFSKLPPEGFGQ